MQSLPPAIRNKRRSQMSTLRQTRSQMSKSAVRKRQRSSANLAAKQAALGDAPRLQPGPGSNRRRRLGLRTDRRSVVPLLPSCCALRSPLPPMPSPLCPASLPVLLPSARTCIPSCSYCLPLSPSLVLHTSPPPTHGGAPSPRWQPGQAHAEAPPAYVPPGTQSQVTPAHTKRLGVVC